MEKLQRNCKYNPIISGQLTEEELKASKDANRPLNIQMKNRHQRI